MEEDYEDLFTSTDDEEDTKKTEKENVKNEKIKKNDKKPQSQGVNKEKDKKKAKSKGKAKEEEEEEEEETKTVNVKTVGESGISKKKTRTRVLLICSRGIIHRHRHLMKDLHKLIPHCKKENKMDSKSKLDMLNEIAEMDGCNSAIFFEARKHEDLYLWFAKTPYGPSVKFLVENVHTMEELKLTGNCLKGSRPLLSFSKEFDESPQFALLKELFTQILSTPKGHPKSKPFFDHVLSFSIVDGKIWFRNFQIFQKVVESGQKETKLEEIGPQFVLTIIRIFSSSFGGSTLYENPKYKSPNENRREIKSRVASKIKQRGVDRKETKERKTKLKLQPDELDELYE